MDEKVSDHNLLRPGIRLVFLRQIVGFFKSLPKNSLARDIRSTFLSLTLILMVLGGVGIGALIYSNSSNSDLVNRLQPLISQNNSMLIEVLEMDDTATNYMRSGDAS